MHTRSCCLTTRQSAVWYDEWVNYSTAGIFLLGVAKPAAVMPAVKANTILIVNEQMKISTMQISMDYFSIGWMYFNSASLFYYCFPI